MIGSPRCSNWLHFLLICSNWASRSGCEVPSIVFLLARKENPRSCKISARADFLIWCPLAVSASTRCARDLLVHWTKLIGSPLGCSSCSKSDSSVASVSARSADALAWPIPLACIQFFQAPLHRIDRDACLTCHLAHAFPSLCFCRKILSPLLLVNHLAHLFVFLFVLVHLYALCIASLPFFVKLSAEDPIAHSIMLVGQDSRAPVRDCVN